jgi:hypothetical protein
MGRGVFCQVIQMGDPVNIGDIRTFKRGEWGAPIPGGSQVEVLDIETAPKPLDITGKMKDSLAYWLTRDEKPTHIVRVRVSYGAVTAWAFLVAPSPATPFALIPYLGGKWFPNETYEPLVAEASILAEAEKIAQSRGYRTIKVRAPKGKAKFKELGYTFEATLDGGISVMKKDLPVGKPAAVDGDPLPPPPSNFQPTPGDPQGGKRKSRRKSRRKPRRKTRKT